MRIKYNKKIVLERKRNGDIDLDTDRGDLYKTFQYNNSNNPVSNWWSDQHQSELRQWQKDLVVGYAADALGPLTLFVINKRGHGYSQDHDICLAYSERHSIWVLSTEHDYWIVKSDYGQIVFNKENSLGSVLIKQDRLQIGEVWDEIKSQLNPKNECTWAAY